MAYVLAHHFWPCSVETYWVTMVLNIVFGVMGAVMYFKGEKLGGGEMSM